jgi:decaprenylphospho-beta-D-erythro-pentofuranosid-2-ulose 2-reductase
VLVLGGSSEIALAIVSELQARSPRDVALVGRDAGALDSAAGQLSAAGCPQVNTFELDALDLARHDEVLERAFRQLGGADIVILAIGVLGERGGLPVDITAARPRRANVVYGASKAGLDSLARGLGDALYEDDVHLLVVRPGFVETKMTRGLATAPLASTAQAVATAVVDGLERGANTVWVPRTLRWLMLMMRLLPRPIFRRIRQ